MNILSNKFKGRKKMKTRILSFLLACLMVMSCIPAMTLFAFAEEEAYDYNKLYVGDGLRYHLSFIGVDVEEEDLHISYTDGTTTKYGTWQAFEPYALESEVAVSSTNSIIAEKTDGTLTPRVYDGYYRQVTCS